MPKGYVSVKIYRGVLIFAATACFLAGIVLLVANHPLAGSIALCSSVATSALLFFSAFGIINRKIDEEQEEAERLHAQRKKAEKPKQPPNYKDLN